ncbi:MAG: glycoside hydrolase 43 family protein [Duncaniella sp.]|uniref:glycoside hydrolase family 43 protein n=1 Tax=Duncaniella sp. TaxID=2518496 RepID=UPI0023C4B4B2|nr:glycoside hydrolase 43 family protein [Duncaniella sp.]MDE5989854.1 glycoside hydrolase 43 family protein [Duncaniella sp.]
MNLSKRISLFGLAAAAALGAWADGKPYVSKVWSPDLGNGQYMNPIIDADYSDPDIVRVGDDFYMTASSFCDIPGLPILHSKDLVNWTLIGHAITEMPEYAQSAKDPSHGNAVWAPAIRYHNGEFYIYYGDPDLGIFMTKTKDPAGPWEPLVLVYAAKGVIDPCPFWDEDGRAYIGHGYAGSRAGVKSIIGMIEMTPDGTKAIGQDKMVYDGHLENETIEGAKVYKRDGWYYIFSPAGGVPTGWQEVLRSKSIWGPYETRNVMEQGSTDINGPHQGGWVDTPDGKEYWFVHFQDKGPYGRVVHLQPMEWREDGWPVIGVDPDGDGRGEPVRKYRKPNVGKTYPVANPVESDEFDSIELGKQWQWKGNPNALWYYTDAQASKLRLFSHHNEGAKTLYGASNLLLQKFPAQNFTATAKVQFFPRKKDGKIMAGERAGIIVEGHDYAALSLVSREDGIYLTEADCVKASKGADETEVASVKIEDGKELYLRVQIRMVGPKKPMKKPDYKAEATFYYSLDGKKFTKFGRPFNVREGHWIGGKVGLFCTRDWVSNDSGWLDIDWFRITK